MLRVLKRWPYGVFLALDLLVSAIFMGAPGETISARLARGRGVGSLPCRMLDGFVFLVFRTPHHCETAMTAFNARQAAASFYSG